MAQTLFANNASTFITSGGSTTPASGTSETWTAYSSTGFPAVTTAANTQFHIVDPARPSEPMTVTNVSGTTWTVVRGAEGTTPVAHAANFTVYCVASSGDLRKPHALDAVFSPMDFSAVGDGVANDDTPVHNAYAAAAAVGGILDITGYMYLCTTPIALISETTIHGSQQNYASGILPGTLINNTTDLFTVVGEVSSIKFEGGYYSASAGHVFNATSASASDITWNNSTIIQEGNFCLWYQTSGIYIDMDVGTGCILIGNASQTTSPWTCIAPGAINCNRWHNCRILASNSIVPFFHIESPGGNSYSTNNSFRDITGEICNAGIICALSVTHLTIDNVVGFDPTIPYNNDIFYIGAGSSGGLASRIVKISNSGYCGGSLGAGVYDVNAPLVAGLILENVGPQSTGATPQYNIPTNAVTIGMGGSTGKSTPAPSDFYGVKAWTGYPGNYTTNVKFSAGFAGTVMLWAIWIPQACTISAIHYGLDVAGAGMSNAYLGLYQWGQASDALYASCATDQSTNMMGGANQYTATLSSSYQIFHSGMYNVGLVIGAATTMPTVIASVTAASAAFTNLGMSNNQYVNVYAGSGLTSLPNPSGTTAVANSGVPVFVLT